MAILEASPSQSESRWEDGNMIRHCRTSPCFLNAVGSLHPTSTANMRDSEKHWLNEEKHEEKHLLPFGLT